MDKEPMENERTIEEFKEMLDTLEWPLERLADIPTEEIEEDLRKSRWDLLNCEMGLKASHHSPLVTEDQRKRLRFRIAKGREHIEVMERELEARS